MDDAGYAGNLSVLESTKVAYVCNFRAFLLSQTFTHACVLLFSMSADIFKNKRFARDVQTKRAFPPPYPPPFCRWMMRGMGDLFRSWKARKWHTYATFVRFYFHKLLHMPVFYFFRCLPTSSKISVSLETSRPNALSHLHTHLHFVDG